MTDLVGHFLIFAVVAIGFLMAPLVIGKLLRPKLPTPEKDAIYECGEPAIGSSYIQFDLRFYVVALLFIIFDVEVAFFFPWASIYGSTVQLADTHLSDSARTELSARLLSIDPTTISPSQVIDSATALQLGWVGLADILVFFGVLLVGFAYVWKRGDLDWIRALVKKSAQAADQTVPALRS
ncbi:MAG TPA: NADH-quinone oxidoreductase subunit A [Planctomycetaceae bacterium]|nr:NADH-quinone oxidoreductase subunit A [Planctomycetaceae bacterium]HQZ65545.1 NADH-quinone oxidoreductase subunit A [Planctomycetaceae bacterium]HRA90433.1 NADH-quinone oxidoreductase subunit A [Planctomycetaceae bacterium]